MVPIKIKASPLPTVKQHSCTWCQSSTSTLEMLFKVLASSVNPSRLFSLDADPRLWLDVRFLRSNIFIVKSLVNVHERKNLRRCHNMHFLYSMWNLNKRWWQRYNWTETPESLNHRSVLQLRAWGFRPARSCIHMCFRNANVIRICSKINGQNCGDYIFLHNQCIHKLSDDQSVNIHPKQCFPWEDHFKFNLFHTYETLSVELSTHFQSPSVTRSLSPSQ